MTGTAGRGGAVSSTDGDNPGAAWAAVSLRDETTVQFTRGDDFGDAEIPWFAIELPE